MKRIIQFLLLGTFFLPVVAVVTPVARANQCTALKAAGSYGFTLTGVLITAGGPVPIAAVGRASVDINGHVTGTEARSVGGGFANETLSGTVTVNPDCTGSLTLNFFEAGQLVRTSVLSTVFVNNQQELQMVQSSLTLPNGANVPAVITVNAKKIFTDQED
ncbi:MAG TPA: hypothetical protein VGR58_02075 [Candidatus Acidoferrum sp.]|nr:hypothetical protein [Candidatus Acidoferrum sp.]